MPGREGIGLDGFHALTPLQATHALYACCSSCFWARRVAAGRPYASAGAVLEAADAALVELGDGELAEALAGLRRTTGDEPGPDEQPGDGRDEVRAATRERLARVLEPVDWEARSWAG